jgi:hypothetical protein
MHPIQDLFLKGFSYVLQIDMHFICTPMWTEFYSCKKWMLQVQTMRDYGLTYKSVLLMCHSSSAICLAQNSVFHGRVKHIKVRYHFLRDHVEKGDIVMEYIDTTRQLVDIFTNPLDATRFASLGGDLGVCHPYDLV